MAQISLYVPDDIAADLKAKAALSGKSVSTLVVELICEKSPQKIDWDAYFAKLRKLGPIDFDITDKDRYFGELRDINLD